MNAKTWMFGANIKQEGDGFRKLSTMASVAVKKPKTQARNVTTRRGEARGPKKGRGEEGGKGGCYAWLDHTGEEVRRWMYVECGMWEFGGEIRETKEKKEVNEDFGGKRKRGKILHRIKNLFCREARRRREGNWGKE